MAEQNVGDIVGYLRIDTSAWQRGLQQAQQQLAQFSQSLTQTTQQNGTIAAQLLRTQSQAATQAAREQMQAARLQAQESMQSARLASQERIAAARQASQAEVLEFRRTTEAARQAFREQREAQRGASAGLGGMFQIAGGIGLATTIGGIVSSLKDFAVSTVQVGARLEQLRASLSAIAGSSAAGQQQFQFLTATAQRLGVALEPMARGWRSLTAAATAANLPLADQQRLLTAVVTEGRRVGTSNEELSRAFTGLSQVASKGRASMEEIRQQIGEALPTAMVAAARGMGRTTEEFEKLIETGSVRFPAFARALTRGFEQMQAASGQMVETSQAAFNRLGNALTAFKDALAQNILPELVRVARVAQSILETATSILRAAGGQQGATIGPTVQDLGGTAAQQREVDRLTRLITTLEARQGAGTPLMQETIRNQIQAATELREQVLATLRTTQDQVIAQEKVTAEVNKTAAATEIQADYVADVTKKLDDLRKAQEAFRKEAALSPERLGRPGSEDFLRGMQQVTGKQLDDLTKLLAAPPQGVTLPEALRRQLAAVDTQYGQLGRTIDGISEKERARRQAERDAAAALRQEQQADARQALQERRERIENLDIFGLLLSPEQEQDLKEQAREQRQRIQEFARAGDLLGLEVSPELEAQRRAQAAFQQRLDAALETQRAPRVERPEVRLRADAAKAGVTLTEAQEAQLRQLTTLRQQQERLNEVLRVYEEIAGSIGNAWTQALTNVAEGTMKVSEAFQAMAKSILQSIAQIAAQEGFRALIRIGAGLLTAAFTGGANATTVNPATGSIGAQNAAALGFQRMQGGGIITKPTAILAGENPATSPEYILNRQQMQAFMSSARGSSPSAGGQAAGGVTVINVPNRTVAEEEAARERAMGREVIINEVLSEMSRGEASRLNRTIRAMAR